MDKRIFEFPEATELQEDDVMLIDRDGTESAKSILASKVAPALMSKTITERGTYKASDDSVVGYNEVDVDIPYTDVHVASGAVASFEGEDLPLKSLLVDIEPVQAGSGDPSPTNVRPISGWTGAKVSVNGINQWDEQYLSGYYNSSGVYVSQSGQICTKNKIEVIPNVTYYLGTSDYLASNVTAICYYDKDGNFISRAFVSKGEITIPANCYYININFGATYGGTYNNDLCFNYPSTITEYVAHNPNSTTYSIPFTDSQGQSVEVYGGNVDIVNGGEQPLTSVCVDMGDLDYTRITTRTHSFFRTDISDIATPIADTISVACTCYKPIGNRGANSFGDGDNNLSICCRTGLKQIMIRDDNYTDANVFKNAMVGQKIVYELATPTTFYTQPTAVRSLAGSNNIFADSGDVDVEYQTIWVRPSE